MALIRARLLLPLLLPLPLIAATEARALAEETFFAAAAPGLG
jgi:hypothetical protein